jgi:hypothetical protein
MTEIRELSATDLSDLLDVLDTSLAEEMARAMAKPAIGHAKKAVATAAVRAAIAVIMACSTPAEMADRLTVASQQFAHCAEACRGTTK